MAPPVVGLGLAALLAVAGSPLLAQTLTIDPPLAEPATTTFAVDVDIDPAALVVQGVHVVVAYDPAVVQLDGIAPGAWLTDVGAPGQAFFFFDYTPQSPAGTLAFDAAFLDGQNLAAGQLAVCSFTALQPGESPLDFIEVDVRDADNQPLAFEHSAGDLIRIADSRVRFEPAVSVPVVPEFTVDLAVAAVGRQVKGAEIVVDYDPAVVELTGIDPGPWIADQGLQYFFFDYTPQAPAGELHLDMSFLDGTGTGNGILAVCRFTAVDVGTSPLDFVTVDVRDDQNQPLAFGHSTGDEIIVEEAIATSTATLGAVKSLFR